MQYTILIFILSDCGKREKEESKWKGKRNWIKTDENHMGKKYNHKYMYICYGMLYVTNITLVLLVDITKMMSCKNK
jgi:hypothetical protein